MLSAEVAIVGAGPAGLAAAMQLVRFGLQPLVFEKDAVGGLLRNANWVENYSGFPGGISGRSLVRRMERQANRIGVAVIFEAVLRLDYSASRFTLETARGRYSAEILVVASGTIPRPILDFQIPPELKNRCLSEIWPLLELHDKRIAIIGAGDAAFDYALNLARANEVILLNRDSLSNSLPLLHQRAAACPKITYHTNTVVQALHSNGADGLLVHWTDKSTSGVFAVDYLITAIGREPATDFISKSMMQQSASLQQHGKLYFVGDVHHGLNRQTAIAVGEGILAAMKIYHSLQEKTQ